MKDNTCTFPGCDRVAGEAPDGWGGTWCDFHAGNDHKHVPEWETLTIAMEFWPDRLVFDIWCGVCGRSGSFEMDMPRDVDILW